MAELLLILSTSTQIGIVSWAELPSSTVLLYMSIHRVTPCCKLAAFHPNLKNRVKPLGSYPPFSYCLLMPVPWNGIPLTNSRCLSVQLRASFRLAEQLLRWDLQPAHALYLMSAERGTHLWASIHELKIFNMGALIPILKRQSVWFATSFVVGFHVLSFAWVCHRGVQHGFCWLSKRNLVSVVMEMLQTGLQWMKMYLRA